MVGCGKISVTAHTVAATCAISDKSKLVIDIKPPHTSTLTITKCVLNNNWQLVFDDQSPCFQLSSSINASHNDRHTSANPLIMLRGNESVCSNHPTSSRLGPKDNLLSHLLAGSSSSLSSSSPSGLMRARPQCRIYRWRPVELPRFVGGLCSLWYNPPISSFVHPCHRHHHHHCHHHK